MRYTQILKTKIFYLQAYVGADEYVHVSIRETMSGGPKLVNYQLNKTYKDALEAF